MVLRTFFIAIEFIIFGILTLPCVGILFIVRAFNKKAAAHIAQAIMRVEARILLWMSGSEIHVEGVENIRTDQPSVFIGNHTGIVDIVLAYAYLPVDTGFISKDQVRKVPPISWLLILTNGLFLDRNNIRKGLEVILTAIEEIKDGTSIFIFPEGTRNKTGEHWELLPFHPGSFKLATKTGAPIVPTALIGSRELFEQHIPWVKPTKLYCIFGEPIYTDELNAEDKKHIADVVREKLITIIKDAEGVR